MSTSSPSSIPPAGECSCEYFDHMEIVPPSDNCGELIALVRAEALFKQGMREQALRLYDESIKKGSKEAMICKGLAIAEGALEDDLCDEMINGLRLALPTARNWMDVTHARRLHKILQRAVDAGWLKGDRQLCTDAVSHVDVYERIVDFVQCEGNEKAALENLYEFMSIYYS